ncbi:acyl-CoA dehydrogenase family protein [Chloroflexota bacterium]
MDFSFSEEQEMLRKMARDFLEAECPEKFVREMEKDEKGYSPELWKKIGDLGWLGLVYPEKYGGTEGNITDMTALYEEIGRAMFPSPHLSTVVLCGLTILDAGSEEQKEDILPRIASGDLILAMALTEPDSSWDGKAWEAEGVTMPATADGDNYIINGTKLFVHDANIADYLLCAARTKDGANPEDGVTLFLVDAKSPGISCTLLTTTAGDKQCEVIFDKVKVVKNNIVGELHGGWAPLAKSLKIGAIMLCAQMLGADQKILDLSVDYAKTRIQFDMPIGINQYIQEHCVLLLKDMDGIRWSTYLAAWKLSQNMPSDLEVAIAKGYGSDAHERACWYAHQVFGGVGYTTEDGVVPLYSRKAKTLQLYLGDSVYHKEKITQQLEKWPAPEMPKGKPLGLWDDPTEPSLPAWYEPFAKGENVT